MNIASTHVTCMHLNPKSTIHNLKHYNYYYEVSDYLKYSAVLEFH